MKTSLIFIIFLNSCNIRPFEVTSARGTITKSLGMSVLTKSTKSLASITSPNGSSISYQEEGKDEVSGAKTLINSYAGIKVASFLKDTTIAKDNNAASVSRADIRSEVSKADIAAGVDKAKLATEVQKEAINSGVEVIPTAAP